MVSVPCPSELVRVHRNADMYGAAPAAVLELKELVRLPLRSVTSRMFARAFAGRPSAQTVIFNGRTMLKTRLPARNAEELPKRRGSATDVLPEHSRYVVGKYARPFAELSSWRPVCWGCRTRIRRGSRERRMILKRINTVSSRPLPRPRLRVGSFGTTCPVAGRPAGFPFRMTSRGTQSPRPPDCESEAISEPVRSGFPESRGKLFVGGRVCPIT